MMYMPLEENWVNEEECMGYVSIRDRKGEKEKEAEREEERGREKV